MFSRHSYCCSVRIQKNEMMPRKYIARKGMHEERGERGSGEDLRFHPRLLRRLAHLYRASNIHWSPPASQINAEVRREQSPWRMMYDEQGANFLYSTTAIIESSSIREVQQLHSKLLWIELELAKVPRLEPWSIMHCNGQTCIYDNL